MKPQVAILMGSDSDLELMLEAAKVLDQFGIAYQVEVTSAHRSPARTRQFVDEAPGRGIKVFIVGAGAAAHLAGAVAAETTLPVIGVPINSSPLAGVDSLYSTVQMPAGVPVATMAIGKAGATNAGVLAVQMLALLDEALQQRLVEYKNGLAEKVAAASKRTNERLESK